LHSRDEHVASVRALLELRPDTRLRVNHFLCLDDRRSLCVARWEGSEAEGIFEIPLVAVTQYGTDATLRRVDVYSLDQLDEARARFEELQGANSKHEIRNSKQTQNSKSE